MNKIFPSKDDGTFEKIRKVILIISILVVLICGTLLVLDRLQVKRQSDADINRAKIRNEAVQSTGSAFSTSAVLPIEPSAEEPAVEKPKEILPQYKSLYAENPEMIGWITIGDTPIDYPVLQTTDNEYYLEHNFDKEYSKMGAIFADYHDTFTAKGVPNNGVIYGHNIWNGTYFAKLAKYSPGYYGGGLFVLRQPTFKFDTIWEEGTYKVFAAVIWNTEDKFGVVYPYFTKRMFKNKSDFYDFVENVMDRSEFFTGVDLEYGDELLTLSTCYYPFGKQVDSRFAVFARKVRPGESAEVDNDKVTQNYARRNDFTFSGSTAWNDSMRKWDAGLVKGYAEWKTEQKNNPDGAYKAENVKEAIVRVN